ncbi:hypothetical protein EUGRSUZ_L00022 [Eucalyptus grandis]|uniref:Uncharacterized protein n=2 Tax=Eucalyptus grandis TaxID=71139 RepID=A0ACC3LZ09_EUCGR|nr:hypothetical protein EUGRSUZ_L00022 [Eucalyptus grandis]
MISQEEVLRCLRRGFPTPVERSTEGFPPLDFDGRRFPKNHHEVQEVRPPRRHRRFPQNHLDVEKQRRRFPPLGFSPPTFVRR